MKIKSYKEIVNICWVSLGDVGECSNKKEKEHEVTNLDPPNIYELKLAFTQVYSEYKSYRKKCVILRRENASLKLEKYFIERDCKRK